jgi:hypothetical protein
MLMPVLTNSTKKRLALRTQKNRGYLLNRFELVLCAAKKEFEKLYQEKAIYAELESVCYFKFRATGH